MLPVMTVVRRVGEPVAQRGREGPGVGDDWQLGGDVRADRLGPVIDVDDSGAGEQLTVPRRPRVQAGADGQEHVGLREQRRGPVLTESSAHSGAEPVAGEQATGHDRRAERGAEVLA
jgi:hypothetical protein